jgi:hypothetical protein
VLCLPVVSFHAVFVSAVGISYCCSFSHYNLLKADHVDKDYIAVSLTSIRGLNGHHANLEYLKPIYLENFAVIKHNE